MLYLQCSLTASVEVITQCNSPQEEYEPWQKYMIAGCQGMKYANTSGLARTLFTSGSISTECPLIEWEACGSSKKNMWNAWVEKGGAETSSSTDSEEKN